MRSRKINVIFILCIGLEVLFIKAVRKYCSVIIVNRAVSAFGDIGFQTVVAEAPMGARHNNYNNKYYNPCSYASITGATGIQQHRSDEDCVICTVFLVGKGELN